MIRVRRNSIWNVFVGVGRQQSVAGVLLYDKAVLGYLCCGPISDAGSARNTFPAHVHKGVKIVRNIMASVHFVFSANPSRKGNRQERRNIVRN